LATLLYLRLVATLLGLTLRQGCFVGAYYSTDEGFKVFASPTKKKKNESRKDYCAETWALVLGIGRLWAHAAQAPCGAGKFLACFLFYGGSNLLAL